MANIFYDDFESYDAGDALSDSSGWASSSQDGYIYSNGSANFVGCAMGDVEVDATTADPISVADYMVSASFYVASLGECYVEVRGRGGLEGAGLLASYGEGWVSLIKYYEGMTTLGEVFYAAPQIGETHTIKLRMEGSTIEVFVDDNQTPIISVVDTDVAAAGVVSLYQYNDVIQYNPSYDLSGGGLFVADFSIDTLAPGRVSPVSLTAVQLSSVALSAVELTD